MEDWEIRQIEKDKIRAIEESNRQQEEAVHNQKEHFDRMEELRREELRVQKEKEEEARIAGLQKQKNDRIIKLKSKIEKLELTWAKEKDSEARSRIQLLLLEAQNELEEYLESCRLEEERERQRQEEIKEQKRIAQEKFLQERDQEAQRKLKEVKKARQKRKVITAISSLLLIIVCIILFQYFNGLKAQKHSSPIKISSSSTKQEKNSFGSSKKTVRVPDIKGLKLNEARQQIEKTGLKVGTITEANTTDVSSGLVLRTYPEIASSVKSGTTIDIIIATAEETFPVPNVVGKDLETAKAELQESGFEIGNIKEETSDSVPAGQVVKTDPATNTSKIKGSKVNIVVSKGVEAFEVPNVAGMKENDAKQALERAGFTIGKIDSVYSDNVQNGLVISTDPGVKASVAKGTAINMTLSKGVAPRMPDFGYLKVSYSDARSQLQELGIQVADIDKVEDSTAVASTGDMVVAQYPPAGQGIDGTVTLYVSVSRK